ncbi:hypothetical protein L596_022476 [Steinernema carpocapsae]|uniref:Uncharacterized protein n=1 Tax=Steinernema carpocapsae TaxID=34508 RepID=A0A4U5MLS9_STECR|nr:hypothetical protein L596_022476 [Steinernema carpocapsae]
MFHHLLVIPKEPIRKTNPGPIPPAMHVSFFCMALWFIVMASVTVISSGDFGRRRVNALQAEGRPRPN